MKKILLAGLFATIAGALVFGAAASLTVTSNDLGSGTGDVAACDTDVDVAYAINATNPALVDTITVSAIDTVACANQTVHISVLDGTSTVLHADSAPVAASVDFDVDEVAEEIEDVAVTITGVNNP